MKNTRPQNKHTPYRLWVDGRVHGCYEHNATACDIGRSMMNSGKATSYCVRNLDDTITGGDYA